MASDSKTMFKELQFVDWVPFPVQHVFAFFSNPQNLPRLMPPEAQMRIDRLQLIPPPPRNGNAGSGEHAAGVGSIITTSFHPFRFLPLRREWIAAITEFEWNHHFADVQQKGPSSDGTIGTNFCRKRERALAEHSSGTRSSTRWDSDRWM